MSHLDNICQYNYKTNQGLCNLHSFPFTRSQAKLQKVAIPSLFGTAEATAKPSQKPSILRDPPAVMARKSQLHFHLLMSHKWHPREGVVVDHML